MQNMIIAADFKDVGEAIRAAVAPVFLLSGVGVMLTLLTNRVARVVDRARALEQVEQHTPDSGLGELGGQLATLALRARLLGRAIASCTICALLICAVVVAMFLGAIFTLHLALLIAALFILAMFTLIGGLIYFLRELFLSTRTLRIGLRGARPP